MFCKRCHYCLKQLHATRCPECGNGFDPNDPTTFNMEPADRGWEFRATLTIAILGLWYIVSMGLASGNTSWEHHPFGGPFIILKEGGPIGLVILAIVLAPAAFWIVKGKIWMGVLAIVMAAGSIWLSVWTAMIASC